MKDEPKHLQGVPRNQLVARIVELEKKLHEFEHVCEMLGAESFEDFKHLLKMRGSTRAAGDCVCEICGKPYRKHPMYERETDWEGRPYLNELCNGRLVKL